VPLPGGTPVILVTVGSTTPFNRLISMCDQLAAEGLLQSPVVAQIGSGSYVPRNMEWHRLLDKCDFDVYMDSALYVIGHAGIGTISQALSKGRKAIVVPRRQSLGESVNDHQLDAARLFSEMQHVLAASSSNELRAAIAKINDFHPKPRFPNTAGLVGGIATFLATSV
jgi:UDP-N-acetylglucosamine transferase subunit ALG13